ncbi:MAG: hypothetical protein FWC41_12685 [Firmicutes bacterium]|nr:hypothetical protein [Bacillota bacterium]
MKSNDHYEIKDNLKIMPKKLDYFFKENSIRKEVEKWSLNDCKKYIENHKNRLQTWLLRKRIGIVKEIIKIHEAKKLYGKARKQKLKGIKIENLLGLVPKQVKDPKDKSFRSHQKNTGIYLWKKGYNPKKFLGKGQQGVVWECDDGKAVKVTTDNKFLFFYLGKASDEVEKSKEIQEIIDKNEKGLKYLSHSKYISSKNKDKQTMKRAIFESEVAKHGSLASYNEKILAKTGKGGSITNILRLGKNALKGLKIIHDAGYSHNDIKPDNLFVIERQSKKLENCNKKMKDILQIADFGAITKISDTKSYSGSYFQFAAPDKRITKPEAVSKRDSYSLGAVFITMLVKKSNNYKDVIKIVTKKGSEYAYDYYKLNEIYDSSEKEKIIQFLDLIKKMVYPNYTNRISIDDALNEIKKIIDNNFSCIR